MPLHANATIREMTGGQPLQTTPLDFVDENGLGWSVNMQPFMGMPVISASRLIQRMPNDRFPMDPFGLQELPLRWEFWSMMPVAVLYGIARLYLVIEAFLELRAAPETAFINVNWATYIPHI